MAPTDRQTIRPSESGDPLPRNMNGLGANVEGEGDIDPSVDP